MTPETLRDKAIIKCNLAFLNKIDSKIRDEEILKLIQQAKEEWTIPLIQLLKVAKCPDCDGSGSYASPDKNGEPIQTQCRWCFERNLIINAPEP